MQSNNLLKKVKKTPQKKLTKPVKTVSVIRPKAVLQPLTPFNEAVKRAKKFSVIRPDVVLSLALSNLPVYVHKDHPYNTDPASCLSTKLISQLKK